MNCPCNFGVSMSTNQSQTVTIRRQVWMTLVACTWQTLELRKKMGGNAFTSASPEHKDALKALPVLLFVEDHSETTKVN
jgi:hypothetical protein